MGEQIGQVLGVSADGAPKKSLLICFPASFARDIVGGGTAYSFEGSFGDGFGKSMIDIFRNRHFIFFI